MGTKTISLDDAAYERLRAEKHDDESFSEVVKRITAEVSSDWRRGFGRFAEGESKTNRFTETMASVRADRAEGIASSHNETLEALGFALDDDGNVLSKPDDLRCGDAGNESDRSATQE